MRDNIFNEHPRINGMPLGPSPRGLQGAWDVILISHICIILRIFGIWRPHWSQAPGAGIRQDPIDTRFLRWRSYPPSWTENKHPAFLVFLGALALGSQILRIGDICHGITRIDMILNPAGRRGPTGPAGFPPKTRKTRKTRKPLVFKRKQEKNKKTL